MCVVLLYVVNDQIPSRYSTFYILYASGGNRRKLEETPSDGCGQGEQSVCVVTAGWDFKKLDRSTTNKRSAGKHSTTSSRPWQTQTTNNNTLNISGNPRHARAYVHTPLRPCMVYLQVQHLMSCRTYRMKPSHLYMYVCTMRHVLSSSMVVHAVPGSI